MKEKCKLGKIANNPEYDDGIQEDIRNRIERLNDDLNIEKMILYSLCPQKNRIKL